MFILKVDDIINNSFTKSFLGSLDWFLTLKSQILHIWSACQFTKYNDFLGVCWFLAKNLAF